MKWATRKFLVAHLRRGGWWRNVDERGDEQVRVYHERAGYARGGTCAATRAAATGLGGHESSGCRGGLVRASSASIDFEKEYARLD